MNPENMFYRGYSAKWIDFAADFPDKILTNHPCLALTKLSFKAPNPDEQTNFLRIFPDAVYFIIAP
jgi:hypothetical protein